jgi:hypothetical protein
MWLKLYSYQCDIRLALDLCDHAIRNHPHPIYTVSSPTFTGSYLTPSEDAYFPPSLHIYHKGTLVMEQGPDLQLNAPDPTTSSVVKVASQRYRCHILIVLLCFCPLLPFSSLNVSAFTNAAPSSYTSHIYVEISVFQAESCYN